MRYIEKRQLLKCIFLTFMFYFAIWSLSVSGADAKEKWMVLGNTIWVSGDSRLTLEMPSVHHPYLKVTSSEAGDFQWIEASIPFVWGSKIKGIYICYQTPDTGTYISQIRLADYILPSPHYVRHDDPTDLFSTTGACYFSHVGDYTPAGAVNLSLRLNFAHAGDEIQIGGLAILIEEGE